MRDDADADVAPLSARCATRVIELKIAAAGNVTPVQLEPGYYQCRCAAGTAAKTITGKLLAASTAVADTTLELPDAGDPEVDGLFAAPADGWFPLTVESPAIYLAVIWDGAADDELILTRTFP